MVKKPSLAIAEDENSIWCLFSVEAQYDQPENNLVAWWMEKPSLETLFKTLGVKMGEKDEDTVAVVKVWSGSYEIVGCGDTSYRLQQIAEGSLGG